MMTITEELLVEGMSSAGGWKAEQLEILGVKWPPREGWKRAVIGQEITEEQAWDFVSWNHLRPL
jgi:hypothetical protein